MATPSPGLLPLSGDLVIDTMTTGYRWNNDGPIGYSFSDGLNGEFFNDPDFFEDQVGLIFSLFDYYTAQSFSYKGYFDNPLQAVSGGSNVNISIDAQYISDEFGNLTLAVGFFPNAAFTQGFLGPDYYGGAEGDIYVNINSIADAYGYLPGDAGFSLILHEIGHAAGLKHPHDSGGTGRPTFDEAGFGALDIDWLTVMSYDDDFDWNLNSWDPATPMILDVIALQYLYGADLTTNAGDSVFSQIYEGNFYKTLYDAGGFDTIDLSAAPGGIYVELPNYVISDHQVAPFGLVTTLAGGVAILEGDSPQTLTWVLGEIEKLIGSAFADAILGSDNDDVILSGNGNDDIYASLGNDTIDGGSGVDTLRFFDPFEDFQITFENEICLIAGPSASSSAVTDVEFLSFNNNGAITQKSVAELSELLNPPAADDWRLFTSNGFQGELGGSGAVLGTSGYNEVSVTNLPGTISFDPSFNKGGDIIRLPGNAGQWQIFRTGSSATLTDGDTFVQLPVGTAGTAVVFDDGARTVKFDAALASFRIGNQTFASALEQISAPSDGTPIPTGADEDAGGRLFLASEASVSAGGRIAVFGTNGAENVIATQGVFQLDPSFNKGGDTLTLEFEASAFTAMRQGSSTLLDSEELDVLIPVGTAGMTLAFAGGDDREVKFDTGAGSFLLGDQVIGTTPVALTDFA